MSGSTNTDRVQQFVAEINGGNIDSIHQFMSADYFTHSTKQDEPKANDVYFDILSDIKAR